MTSIRYLSLAALALLAALTTTGCAGEPTPAREIRQETPAQPGREPGLESPAPLADAPIGHIAVSEVRYDPNQPPADSSTLHGARTARPVPGVAPIHNSAAHDGR